MKTREKEKSWVGVFRRRREAREVKRNRGGRLFFLLPRKINSTPHPLHRATIPETMSAAENPVLSLNQRHAIDDILEAEFAQRRCCFCFPRTSTLSSSGRGPSSSSSFFSEQISGGSADGGGGGGHGNLWVTGWNRVKEWSEIVAGPKWKMFRRNRGGGGGGRHGKFGYDPLSYAMNFDEGPLSGGNNNNSYYGDEDVGLRDFSSRYAAIPASAKSSVAFPLRGVRLSRAPHVESELEPF